MVPTVALPPSTPCTDQATGRTIGTTLHSKVPGSSGTTGPSASRQV